MCSITQNTNTSSVWRRLEEPLPSQTNSSRGEWGYTCRGNRKGGLLGAWVDLTASLSGTKSSSGDAHLLAFLDHVALVLPWNICFCWQTKIPLPLWCYQLPPLFIQVSCFLTSSTCMCLWPFLCNDFPLQLPPLPAPVCCYPGEIPERELHWLSRLCTPQCTCLYVMCDALSSVTWVGEVMESESCSLSSQARTSLPLGQKVTWKSHLHLIFDKHCPF